MTLDDSGIVARAYPDYATGETLVVWDDARPQGTAYRVYLDGVLHERTVARKSVVTVGPRRALVTVTAEVPSTPLGGGVAVDPTPPSVLGLGAGGHVAIGWSASGAARVGGAPVETYRVRRGDAPGSPALADSATVGLVPAGRPGGWQAGGWQAGGWQAGASAYHFVDRASLAPGGWSYRVEPIAADGRVGAAATAVGTVEAPPRSVSPLAGSGRTVAIDATDPANPVLRWGHSPDWTPPGTATDGNEIQHLITEQFASGSATSATVRLAFSSYFAVLESGMDSAAILMAIEATIPPLIGNVAVTGPGMPTPPTPQSAPVAFEFVGDFAGRNITAGFAVEFFSGYASAQIQTIREGEQI